MITIVATVCLGVVCADKVVTDSILDNRVTISSCAIGQRELADWMTQNWPGYQLAGWKCVIGNKRHDI